MDSVGTIGKRRAQKCTYVVAKKAAIISKISVSLLEVSSNPGVSTRVTGLPSRAKFSTTWTSAVHDFKPIPTRRSEPLARLINWRQLCEFLIIITGHALLTDVFPLPVAPMTLTKYRMRLNQETGFTVTYAIMADGIGVFRCPFAFALSRGGGGL